MLPPAERLPWVRKRSADDPEPMSALERKVDTTHWKSGVSGHRLGGFSDRDAAESRLRPPGLTRFSGCGQFRTLKPIIFASTPYGRDIDEATDGSAGYVMAGSLLGQPG